MSFFFLVLNTLQNIGLKDQFNAGEPWTQESLTFPCIPLPGIILIVFFFLYILFCSLAVFLSVCLCKMQSFIFKTNEDMPHLFQGLSYKWYNLRLKAPANLLTCQICNSVKRDSSNHPHSQYPGPGRDPSQYLCSTSGEHGPLYFFLLGILIYWKNKATEQIFLKKELRQKKKSSAYCPL